MVTKGLHRLLASALMLGSLLVFAMPIWGQDSDGDDLTNEQEEILGTDPLLSDTDGDGFSDGDEFFLYFTDPLNQDTDGDGIADAEDTYPRELTYQDLNGITTTIDSILGDSDNMRIHQFVQVRVGNVITIDWTNHIDNFSVKETEFNISFDFLDPNREDFAGDGYYRPVENAETPSMEIFLPSYEGIFETTLDWPGNVLTISDWIYYLFSKPLEVGQEWEFNVFYHELARWEEDPFFRASVQIVDEVEVPIETKLGRKTYQAYEVRAVFKHVPFEDPFFRAFLGEDPELVLQALITSGESPQTQVILRYTTPFFRITPTRSVGFSDFLVQH